MTFAPKILVIEDEERIAEMLQLNLQLEGYAVDLVSDGLLAKAALDLADFDLLVLDIMLPKINGIDVCKYAKSKQPELPILMLSALDSGDNRIEGLKAGADDYMTKPFRLEEFLIRVKNLLKRHSRSNVANGSAYFINGKTINFDAFQIIENGKESIALTKREALFLRMLLDRPNVVISRDEILEKLWDLNDSPSARTIDNFILSFRKIFEFDPKQPQHFIAVRGVGYMYQT